MTKLTLEEFSDLHDKIKAHSFRLNNDSIFAKEYKEFLYELSNNFYFLVKETKYSKATNMIHDFNLWISNLDRVHQTLRDFANFHVERCISVIHTFIETKEVPFYYDSFKNKRDGAYESVKIVFDEETGKYHIPQYKEFRERMGYEPEK